MNGENTRTASTSSPKSPTRSGSRPVVGKHVDDPAADGELPAILGALDALVARQRERLARP